MRPAFLLALLLVVGWSATPALAAPERVAIVDMIELITKHPQAETLRRKLEQREHEAEAYADQEQKALRKLAQEIELMNRNNPMRASKEKLLLTQQTMLKLEIEWRREEARREYMTGLENLYATVQRLVSRYAREHGLQLVLQKTEAELKAVDFSDYAARVQRRTVVFGEPAMDITANIKAMFMPRAPQPAGQPRGSNPRPPLGNPPGRAPGR